MRKGWKMEYGMWNIEYGGWELAGGSWLPEYGKILVTNLGINCVQTCVSAGVKAVRQLTHNPQVGEQTFYRSSANPHNPQLLHQLLHDLSPGLSTACNRLITDTEAGLTTVST